MKSRNRKVLFSSLIVGWFAGCAHIDEQHAQDMLNEAKSAYQKAYAQNYSSNELAQVGALINQAEQTQDPEEKEKLARLAQKKIQMVLRQPTYPTTNQKIPLTEEDNDDDNRPQSWEEILTQFKHKKISQGWLLVLDSNRFEGNHLLPAAQSQVKRLASFLKQHPHHLLTIESYTNSLGDNIYSLGLAQRIAEEVRLILLQRGVSSQRVTTKSSVKETTRKSGKVLKHHVDLIVSGTSFR